MFYYYDWTYILVLIGAALSLWASGNVNSAIAKYRKVGSQSGMTASEAARRILRENGIFDVTVKQIGQGASDYYNPSTKELCLLAPNYNSTSIASIGIAAHECGHAIQDATDYAPLTIQRYIAPVCAFGLCRDRGPHFRISAAHQSRHHPVFSGCIHHDPAAPDRVRCFLQSLEDPSVETDPYRGRTEWRKKSTDCGRPYLCRRGGFIHPFAVETGASFQKQK